MEYGDISAYVPAGIWWRTLPLLFSILQPVSAGYPSSLITTRTFSPGSPTGVGLKDTGDTEGAIDLLGGGDTERKDGENGGSVSSVRNDSCDSQVLNRAPNAKVPELAGS